MDRQLVRVLFTPGDDREIGDDWLLADFGEGPNGRKWYLTTDHVRGSEVPAAIDTPEALAKMVAELINSEWRKAMKKAKP